MPDFKGGIERVVRMIVDPKSTEKVEREFGEALEKGTDPKKAKKNVREVESAFDRLKSVAIKVGAVLGSLWVVKQVAQYTKAVFALGSSVLAVGNQFDAVFGKHLGKTLRDRTEDLRRMAGLTNRQIQELMAGAGSMGQGFGMAKAASAEFAEQIVALSADLASFNNVGTAEAAQLVQSALIGNTEAARSLKVAFTAADVQNRALAMTSKRTAAELTQQEKAVAALAVMTERAGPMIGDLERTQNDADNAAKQAAASVRELKESFAALLVEGFSVVPFFRNATETGEGLTAWITENEDNIRGLGTAFGEVASAVLELSGNLVSATVNLKKFLESAQNLKPEWLRDREAQIQAAIGGAAPAGAGPRPMTEAEAMRADQVASRMAVAQAEAEERAARKAAEAAKAAAAAARDQAEARAKEERDKKRRAMEAERDLNVASTPSMGMVSGWEPETPDPDRWNARFGDTSDRLRRMREMAAETQGFLPGSVEAAGISPEAAEARREWKEAQADAAAYAQSQWAMIESASVNAAMGATGAWQDFFDLAFENATDLGEAFEALGAGMGAALLGGLAEFASGKVAENIAWAIEALAKGLTTKDPSQFVAAAKFTAASAAWSALAGAGGAGQSHVAGGGRGGLSGGIPTGATDIGGRIADRQQPSSETHIHLHGDGFHALNPHVQSVVHGAYELGKQAAGNNTKVHYHRGGGG